MLLFLFRIGSFQRDLVLFKRNVTDDMFMIEKLAGR